MASWIQDKSSELSPHDVGIISASFAQLKHLNSPLFKRLKKRAQSLVQEMDTLALSRTIFGFGISGEIDHIFFSELCSRVRNTVNLASYHF